MYRYLAGFLVFLIAGCSGVTENTEAAEIAVQRFHAMLDAENYAAIYANTNAGFRESTSEEDFTKLLTAVHGKLGAHKSSENTNWNVNWVNGATMVNLVYESQYQKGKAVETFIFEMDYNKARMFGYNINSDALIYN